MLNQVAVEALYSATYVENYLDSVENLPDDAQRHLSRIRDIDVQYRSHLRDVEFFYGQVRNLSGNSTENTAKRARYTRSIQQSLISAQELGDEKIQIVNQLHELIDHKTRQLDLDYKNLDYGKEEQIHNEPPQKMPRAISPSVPPPVALVSVESQQLIPSPNSTQQREETPTNQTSDKAHNNTNPSQSNITNAEQHRTNKRSRRPRNENNTSNVETTNNESNSISEVNIAMQKQSSTTQNATGGTSNKKTAGQSSGSGKKKKRKARGQGNNQTNARDAQEDTPPPDPIDPDEPTYCLCDQISFGEMILCDNDLCPIEWFHFSCVALTSKPKGKWYCPNCRGDRPNIMKPKAQFLKELALYNSKI